MKFKRNRQQRSNTIRKIRTIVGILSLIIFLNVTRSYHVRELSDALRLREGRIGTSPSVLIRNHALDDHQEFKDLASYNLRHPQEHEHHHDHGQKAMARDEPPMNMNTYTSTNANTEMEMNMKGIDNKNWNIEQEEDESNQGLTSFQVIAREYLAVEHKPLLAKAPQMVGAFIHIGKTGGSTLSTLLRNGCHSFMAKPCEDKDISKEKETAVSKLTTYYHIPDLEIGRLYREAHMYDFFLFTIRDPFERTVSSFLYTHPENMFAEEFYKYKTLEKDSFEEDVQMIGGSEEELFHYLKKNADKSSDHIESKQLYSCFPTLEAYASFLDDSGNYVDGDWKTQVENGDCANVAKKTLHHGIAGGRVMTHAYYDYRKIAFMVREINLQQKTVLVTRVEHLNDDWISANRYLGQEGEIETPIATARDSSEMNYPVKKILSSSGRRKLCMALESEYKVYLKLVVYAQNLTNEHKDISLELANKNCPWLELKLPRYEMQEPVFDEGGDGLPSTNFFI